MKVLQINCVYKKGSTGKITADVHSKLMEQGIESIVCYGRGEVIREEHVYKTCPEWYAKLNKVRSMLDGVMYSGCCFSTNKLIRIIRREKPDVVHLQCINGYFVNIYRLLRWLKENHIKTVLTLHAEFMYTGGCGHAFDCTQWNTPEGCGRPKCPRYRAETKSVVFDRTSTMWRRMKTAFDGFDDDLIVTSVSPWLMQRAKQSPILCDKRHVVVYNGLNTRVFHPYETDEEKKRLGIANQKIVIHVTAAFSAAPNHIKGGRYVIEAAKRMIDENVIFLVVGPHEEGISVPPNVRLLGRIADQALLAKYYSMADVTLLTSKKETFSMVTAESLCCGTPVVGFKAGAPEQITIPEYSRFVDYGDMNGLLDGIHCFLSQPKDEKMPEKAAIKYSTETMAQGYLNCY